MGKTDTSTLTAEELIVGIRETQAALRRSDELCEKILKLGVKTPSALRLLADSKVPQHVRDDLAELEAAYEKWVSGGQDGGG